MGRIDKWEKAMWRWNLPHKGDKPLGDFGLTLITAFCNDLRRFDHMFDIWCNYSDYVKNRLHIVIIDDHSKEPVAPRVEARCGQIDFNLQVYRIKDDLLWNTPGAWNLGFTRAPTEWAVNVASDVAFDPEEMEKLLTLRVMNREIYKFSRRRVTNNQYILDNWNRVFPHTETFLMQKKVFKDLGGFDEDFVGAWAPKREEWAETYPGYGIWDNHLLSKIVNRGYWYGDIQDINVTEYMEDTFGATETLRDDNLILRNKMIWRDKLNGVVSEDVPMLRFKWEKMLEYQRLPGETKEP